MIAELLDGLKRDMQYGARALRRAPVLSSMAVISVALGIGANTAIFSLVYSLLLQPVSGVRAPRELVGIEESLPSTILDDLAKQPVFAGVCGVSTPLLTTEMHGDVEPIGILSVTGGCTNTLGVKAELGRLIQPGDDRENGPRVAVLTDSYWRRAFAGRADAMGSIIRIDGVPFTIVGVAEPQFHGVLLGYWPGAMVPAAQDPSGAHVTAGIRHFSWIHALARLRPGVSTERARAWLRSSQQRLLDQSVPSEYQGARRQEYLSQSLNMVSEVGGLDYSLRGRFGRPVTVLQGICVLVLLISCVNLANLLLARHVRRRSEIAVRLAIGASRARIVRQLTIESLLLVSAGTLLGLLLASVADRVLLTAFQSAFIHFSLKPSADGTVLCFAIVLAVATGIGFGLLPACRGSDVSLATSLKGAGRGMRAGAGGRLLIAAQVALTLVLVAGSTLFLASLERLHKAPLGFQADGVVEAQLFPVPHGYENFSEETYYHDLMERAASLPGVESVSCSNYAPLFGGGSPQQVRLTSDPLSPGLETGIYWVSEGFLGTMRIPLLSGRDFSRSDRASGPRTAIIARSLAVRLSPDGNVIGRHVRVGTHPENQDLEIIGVAADALLNGPHSEHTAVVYLNIWQHSYSAKYGVLLARTRNLTPGFVDLLRRTVRSAGHEYVEYARTLDQQLENSLLEERLLAWFASAFGILALVLAATGLYGLLAYHVASRTGEFGIRMALGATRASVRWLVMREALRLVAIGAALGLVVTFLAGRFVENLLYGVRSFEPGPLAAAVAILAGIAAIAAWVPARRACSLEPIEALRHE